MKRTLSLVIMFVVLMLCGCSTNIFEGIISKNSKDTWKLPYNLEVGMTVGEVQKKCNQDFMLERDRYDWDTYYSDHHYPDIDDYCEFFDIDLDELYEENGGVTIQPGYTFIFNERNKLLGVNIFLSWGNGKCKYLLDVYYEALSEKFDVAVSKYDGYYAWETDDLVAVLYIDSCSVAIGDADYYYN